MEEGPIGRKGKERGRNKTEVGGRGRNSETEGKGRKRHDKEGLGGKWKK